jgi:hypothetical protein
MIISEQQIRKIIRRVIFEDRKESMLEKMKRKLKGISDDKLIYNMENDLPWDWKGSKEAYFEQKDQTKT